MMKTRKKLRRRVTKWQQTKQNFLIHKIDEIESHPNEKTSQLKKKQVNIEINSKKRGWNRGK